MKTCYLPDSVEHLQLFGIQRRNIFKLISAENKKARHETNVLWDSPGKGRRLPQDPRHQEVEAALDLGAVDETVDVAGVHSLSVLCACAFTHCRDEHTPASAGLTERKTHFKTFLQPFGQSPLQSSHCLWPPRSTSILPGGQTLTQDLPSTTKWAARRDGSAQKRAYCHKALAGTTIWVRSFRGHSLGHWETQMDPYWYLALGLVSIWNVCLL